MTDWDNVRFAKCVQNYHGGWCNEGDIVEIEEVDWNDDSLLVRVVTTGEDGWAIMKDFMPYYNPADAPHRKRMKQTG